jgi:GDPmannose 4,6-dehydratase
LGNLDSRRDWGFAGDYVQAMWMMLQHNEPDDFVVATGEAYSVREFLDAAFERAGLDWKQYVELDPRYLRPTEVDYLMGDPTKARETLGWQKTVNFPDLVNMMVDQDTELAKQESTLMKAGHDISLRGFAHA